MFKNPLAIAASLIIILGISGVVTNYNSEEEYLSGSEVVAEVIDKPINCESITSKSSFIKLKYQDLIVSKKIGYGYCDDLDKDSLTVIVTHDKKNLFFKKEIENFPDQIGFSCLIIIVGIFCFMKAQKKKLSQNN